MFEGRWEAHFTAPAGVTVAATNAGGGPTTVTVPAGLYTLSGGVTTSLLVAFQGALNAARPAGWTVTMSTTTGLVSINCTGTWALTWTSTALRDLLGFAANIASGTGARTGTKQAKSLWFPDCTMDLDGVPQMAPRITDRRGVETPSGVVYTHVSNQKLQHKDLRYSHVPQARFREAAAPYGNASYETWVLDTQDGGGHAWFRPGSPVTIRDHAGVTLGSDGAVPGWYLHNLPHPAALSLTQRGWTGYVSLVVPRLTAAVP